MDNELKSLLSRALEEFKYIREHFDELRNYPINYNYNNCHFYYGDDCVIETHRGEEIEEDD